MTTYTVLTSDGDRHSTHQSYRDAVDQADMIRGEVQGDAAAWDYARLYQGFSGDFAEWQSQDDDERHEYEMGAAGVPTA